MRRHLPSLCSLQAFEAVARHLSFTRAAIALNLTQTAVSHRIRKLEEDLGGKLFVREGNSIRLTESGRRYLEHVRNILDELSVATDRASDRHSDNTLTVASLATFAMKILIPGLGEFRKQYPELSIRVRIISPRGFAQENDYDVAIMYGGGTFHGDNVEPLDTEEVFPVCSPKLLTGRKLREPRDLESLPVIRAAAPLLVRDDWPIWLRKAHIPDLVFADEISFDSLYAAFEATVSGLGVIMGRSSLISEDIKAGRLVEPFSIRVPSPSHYYLVSPNDRMGLERTQTFRRWLQHRMAAMQ